MKSKITGDMAVVEFEKTNDTRANGLIVKKLLEEGAYKLGCILRDIEVEVISSPLPPT